MKAEEYYSHGKLLITGEYLVLDGALALALPVKQGQFLRVGVSDDPGLHWTASHPGGIWFEAHLSLPALDMFRTTDRETGENLVKLLKAIRSLNPSFLSGDHSLSVTTGLEFRREWGFGSSSTLISNLAGWAGIDPFQLHWKVSKGSGYDIACASAAGPLLYRLTGNEPVVTPVRFHPGFSDSLYFVYLGKKQDSAAGISAYRNQVKSKKQAVITEVSNLTEAMLAADSLREFAMLMHEHESLLGKVLGAEPLSRTIFHDFPGAAKSLGAWGGDFALLASEMNQKEVAAYVERKGLRTIFGFDELVIKHPEHRL